MKAGRITNPVMQNIHTSQDFHLESSTSCWSQAAFLFWAEPRPDSSGLNTECFKMYQCAYPSHLWSGNWTSERTWRAAEIPICSKMSPRRGETCMTDDTISIAFDHFFIKVEVLNSCNIFLSSTYQWRLSSHIDYGGHNCPVHRSSRIGWTVAKAKSRSSQVVN